MLTYLETSSQVAQGQHGRRRGNSRPQVSKNSGVTAGPSRVGAQRCPVRARGARRSLTLLFSPVQCTIA